VPAFANNKVFIASNDGAVTALDDTTGKKLWRIKISKTNLSAGPAANSNMLFVCSQNGQVFALRQSDGSIVWNVNLPGEILSAPAANDTRVAVKTADSKLIVLATNNGNKVWDYESDQPALTVRSSSAPKISDDVLVSGFANGELAAFDVNSGHAMWRGAVATPKGKSTIERMVDIDADPVIFNGAVYAAAFQGGAVAVLLRQGKVVWQNAVSSYEGLTADAKTLYVTDTQDTLWAFDRATGKKLWQQDALAHRGVSAPAALNSAVVTGDSFGYLHFMDRQNGNFTARLNLNCSGVSQPVVHAGFLYVVTRDGYIAKIITND
jgi:outer membrane protein assembly factor BamB